MHLAIGSFYKGTQVCSYNLNGFPVQLQKKVTCSIQSIRHNAVICFHHNKASPSFRLSGSSISQPKKWQGLRNMHLAYVCSDGNSPFSFQFVTDGVHYMKNKRAVPGICSCFLVISRLLSYLLCRWFIQACYSLFLCHFY